MTVRRWGDVRGNAGVSGRRGRLRYREEGERVHGGHGIHGPHEPSSLEVAVMQREGAYGDIMMWVRVRRKGYREENDQMMDL